MMTEAGRKALSQSMKRRWASGAMNGVHVGRKRARKAAKPHSIAITRELETQFAFAMSKAILAGLRLFR